MKTLIAHQFNLAMRRLGPTMQEEVSKLFLFSNSADKEHLFASPLTQIESPNNDIFTLRGKLVRIFCTFLMEENEEAIVFLDVKPVRNFSRGSGYSDLRGEVTLFGAEGYPIAYIDDSDEKVIFTFNGEPVAYIDEDHNVYGFNGAHLGWYEDQIVWDHSGCRVGFTKNTCPTFTRFEPFKGFKQFKPFKSFKQFAPFRSIKKTAISNASLLDFLKAGR
jgi:hypothetical protein